MRTRIGTSATIGTLFAVAIAALAAAQTRQSDATPAFAVDPYWPKPLPNHWLLGSVTGVAVDHRDHVWVVHRGAASMTPRTEIGLATDPPTAEFCCAPAPHVLQFDPSGALVSHWGGPGDGYDWPQSPGGITVDRNGHVWIAAAGPADPLPGARGRGAAPADSKPDGHVLKFDATGRLLLQIGKPGAAGGNDSRTALHRPAALDVDVAANEVYVADGLGNRRVVVFDATTGAYKRHWGAYGAPPGEAAAGVYDPAAPASKQFSAVNCVKVADDGRVYVCDRRNNRIQVFGKDGAFMREVVIAEGTRGEGAVWSIAFSPDAPQRLLYVADGSNQKVHVLDRQTLTPVSSVGGGGRWPGHFYGVGSVAVDSSGHLYTGETYEGKRVQKFISKGSR